MSLDLDAGLRALRGRSTELLGRLEDLDEEALKFAPSDKDWNILEVLDHVLKSEELGLVYAGKKLPHVTPQSRVGLRSKLTFPLLLGVLALPFKLRMPNAIRQVVGPGSDLSLQEIGDRWRENHGKWRAFVDEVPAELSGAPLFRHPISGAMNLGDTVTFFSAHFDRHLRQIDRLFAHPDFPGPVPRRE